MSEDETFHMAPEDPTAHWSVDAEHRIAGMPLGKQFTTADIVHAQRKAKVEMPSEMRAYGSFIRRLAGEGLITKVGYTKTPLRSHSGTTTVWARTALPGEE